MTRVVNDVSWKLLLSIWVIGSISIWLIYCLGVSAIAAQGGAGGSDMFVSMLTDPMIILGAVVAGALLTPCCYCYGKINE